MPKLAARSPYEGSAVPPGWVVSETYQHGGRLLTAATYITIQGERGGVFRFVRHVLVPPAGRRRKPREWVDVIGGTAGVTMWRSFDPARIGRVVRK